MMDRTGQHLGNYQIVRLLGRGGFAEVYLGQHRFLDQRQVAIKILSMRLNAQHSADFQHEANQLAALKHPNIVPLLDFSVQEEIAYLIMDYYPEGTLRQRHLRGERLPMELVLNYVQQIARALDYAHSQRIIHRDVKPENMLIGQTGEILLSDFGVATAAHATSSMSVQAPVGTIPYMAPEQIQAQARPASDQYALGIVVYEWLSGGRPFEGSYTEIFAKHLMAAPPPLRTHRPELPLAVEQVILTALAKEAKERFSTVQAFANALTQASDHLAQQPTFIIPGTDISPTLPVDLVSPVLAPPFFPPSEQNTPQVMALSEPDAQRAAPAVSSLWSNRESSMPTDPRQTPLPREQPPPPHRKTWLVAVIALLILLLSSGTVVLALRYLPGTSPSSVAAGKTVTAGKTVSVGPTTAVTVSPVVSPTVLVQYPAIAGNYSGSIDNTLAGISSTMTLQINQDQSSITGQFAVAPPLQGTGPFTGSVDTTDHLQFTVTSPDTVAPILFQGILQPDSSLSGTYCSVNIQGQCDTSVGGHGTWQVTKK